MQVSWPQSLQSAGGTDNEDLGTQGGVRGLVHTDKRVTPEGTGLSLWGRLVQATRTRKTFGDKMENSFSFMLQWNGGALGLPHGGPQKLPCNVELKQ